MIFSESGKNEIIRKDKVIVNIGDTINFQIASETTYAAGMISIYFE